MSEPLAIETGDPEDGPASFSRFLLPFSYRKERLDSPPAEAARFVPAAPPPCDRRQYLTFETAQVLYERALWLELRAGERGASRELTIYRPLGSGQERAIPVRLAAPRLVLFEWPAAAPKGEREEEDPFATGFLVVELAFPKPPVTLDDLCFVNELFRYWTRPFAEHAERKPYLRALREAPRSLDWWLDPATPKPPGEDPYFDRWAWLLSLPCDIEGTRWRLVSPEARAQPSSDGQARARAGDHDQARQWAAKGHGKSGWVVYSDARAYVWTCAVLARGGGHLAEERAWTALLNVDPPGGGELSAFERGWVRERTYGRWVESGSLYGFTLHSGAAIVPPWREPPLWQHFRDSYFDQTLLLLYTRVGLFRFSRWLSDASARARDRGAALIDRDLEQDLSRIRKSLTLFANLYQFPLLSNQQQGVEMYEKAREVMDIRELAEELHTQVDGCHELLDMLADQAEAKAAVRLSFVATVGVPFALATGFLGMNVISEDLSQGRQPESLEWTVAGASLLVAIAMVVVAYRATHLGRLARRFFRSRKERRTR